MQKTKRRSDIAAIFTCLLLIISLICYTWMMRTPSFLSLKAGKPFLNWIMQNSDLALAVLFLILTSVPFYLTFDKRKAQARDLVPVALMAAMCVVGRAAFSIVPLPNFKPVTAIVMITAIAFGAKAGYLTGALAALLSNFLFGQGPWTPWQMFSYGMIGYLAGILFQKGILKARKVDLCIYGFLSVFLIFGGIMNPASILMAYGYITKKSLIAFYISGAPVDLVQATSTVIFLWILSRPLLEKLERVKRKYGLLQRPENKEENEYDKE